MVKSELPSTWRVYLRDWVFFRRFRSEEIAEAEFEATFGGRLKDQDWEIRVDESATNPYELWVRLWNVSGEWKNEKLAQEFAEDLEESPEDVRVVARNSKEEHTLRQYGVLKLI